MKKFRTNPSIQSILGVCAALLGIASGALYEYHNGVVAYRPDDVTNGVALYALVGSLVLWAVFIVLYLKPTNK